MKYTRTALDAVGYELAPHVVSSAAIEARVEDVYAALRIAPGQLEALTGIRERRWWDPDFRLSDGAISAGRKALENAGVSPRDIGALIYAGVCRENFEPATACRVAEGLGVSGDAAVYDLSNACLGVLSGVLDIANRIELGQIRAGLVVSCESARDINEIAMERLLAERRMEVFKESLATFTGGSGAVALLLSDGSFGVKGRRLLGGALRAAPEHHGLCRWGLVGESGHAGRRAASATSAGGSRNALLEVMETDAIGVLKNGVALGRSTWEAFLKELRWRGEDVDRVICHQVGSANKQGILTALGIPAEKDFSTYEYLGNMGTVSLPLTAELASERGFLKSGDRVAFLGIGSGLNCLMLGWQW